MIPKEQYPEFKNHFWKWFDNLPIQMKQKFWYYQEDIAETNFYFSVWSKRK